MIKKRKRKYYLRKEKKKEPLMGITVGGPAPGVRFQVDFNTKAHIVLLPANPVYCAAVYAYTRQTTALGEMIAAFSRGVKR